MSLESCLIDSSECVGTENAQTFDLTPSETGDRSTFMSKKSKNQGFLDLGNVYKPGSLMGEIYIYIIIYPIKYPIWPFLYTTKRFSTKLEFTLKGLQAVSETFPDYF